MKTSTILIVIVTLVVGLVIGYFARVMISDDQAEAIVSPQDRE